MSDLVVSFVSFIPVLVVCLGGCCFGLICIYYWTIISKIAQAMYYSYPYRKIHHIINFRVQTSFIQLLIAENKAETNPLTNHF